MNSPVDIRLLIGFFSATGVPALVNAIVGFAHPSIYTITCGKAWFDGIGNCYADDRAEAILNLGIAMIAVIYGLVTLYQRVKANPTPPAGTTSAIIPTGQVPVTIDRDGTDGLASAKALPGTVAEPIVIPAAAAATKPPA